MPPPPVTPSPRRFIIKKDAAPVRRTPLVQAHTPRPSTQHFNSTPRFNFPSTPQPAPTQTTLEHTPGPSRFIAPALKEEQDVIEDLPDDLPYDLHESIECDDNDEEIYEKSLNFNPVDDNGYEKEEEGEKPLTKRRRITSPMLLDEDDEEDEQDNDTINQRDGYNEGIEEDVFSSSIPSIPSPQHKRPHSTFAHHKFLLATPGPATKTSHPPQTPTNEIPFIKPPKFRDPEPSSSNPSEPLPDQFSPHRKGQKYLQGGLASELRDWLTNISSMIPAQSGNKEDPWTVKILIDEVSGGARTGMTMVSGRQVHEENQRRVVDYLGQVRCMLAGEGMGNGVQKGERVQVGKLVGIKGPGWEVIVEGLKWGVAVEWKVLT